MLNNKVIMKDRPKCFFVCFLFIIFHDIGTSTSTSNMSSVSHNDTNSTSTGTMYNSMANLYTKLVKNYDKRIRPKKNLSESVNITGTFILTGIYELETSSQKLTIMGCFEIMWSDEMILWDSVLHGGIEVMKIPIGQVWTPNMKIQTSIVGNGKMGDADDILKISSNGVVMWVTDETYKIICDVNIKFYPFDKQSCEMYVYVKDTVITEVNLSEFSAIVSEVFFTENSEWKLTSIRSQRIVIHNIVTIIVSLELERRHAFIIYTMVAPLVLLSVLNIGVYIVPIDSGEKGSISVTIFLSYGVFIGKISDDLPHNSLNMSYVLIYILVLLLLSVGAVVYSYVQSFIYARMANEKVTFGCLRKLLFFNKRSQKLDSDASDSTETKLTQVERDEITWIVLLRRLDIVAFVFFSLVITVGTPCFFGFIYNRSG